MERRPFIEDTLHLDPALMLLYDAMGSCQSQARSLTDFFRCEKRLKNTLQSRRIHSRTAIGNPQASETPGAGFGMLLDPIFGDLFTAGVDAEATAFAHG